MLRQNLIKQLNMEMVNVVRTINKTKYVYYDDHDDGMETTIVTTTLEVDKNEKNYVKVLGSLC